MVECCDGLLTQREATRLRRLADSKLSVAKVGPKAAGGVRLRDLATAVGEGDQRWSASTAPQLGPMDKSRRAADG
ncbi:hypothetical protein D0Z08_00825 [Nocardioides immobilis]|uniref:Uncharacterized protein n=1 Tax=Nocardioides immobilis TaxID=2049295 RepID=A0A417Y8Y0_9ACTN|nr:hypothetical protein D0Z08_00825 [Nocardioides immobilis]